MLRRSEPNQELRNTSHLRVKRFASLEKEYGQAWALPLAPLLDGSQSFDGTLDKNAVWFQPTAIGILRTPATSEFEFEFEFGVWRVALDELTEPSWCRGKRILQARTETCYGQSRRRYLMLRASECFVSRHGRTPGRGSAGAPTADIPLLRAGELAFPVDSLLQPEPSPSRFCWRHKDPVLTPDAVVRTQISQSCRACWSRHRGSPKRRCAAPDSRYSTAHSGSPGRI